MQPNSSTHDATAHINIKCFKEKGAHRAELIPSHEQILNTSLQVGNSAFPEILRSMVDLNAYPSKEIAMTWILSIACASWPLVLQGTLGVVLRETNRKSNGFGVPKCLAYNISI